MSQISKLLSGYPVPKVAKVRQTFNNDILEDVSEISFRLRCIDLAVVNFVEVTPDCRHRTVVLIGIDVGAAEGSKTHVFGEFAVSEQVSEGVGNKHARIGSQLFVHVEVVEDSAGCGGQDAVAVLEGNEIRSGTPRG